MKNYFIVNPVSGKNEALKVVKNLLKNADSDFNYEIIVTEFEHHATRIAKTIAERGEGCRIFACGGDGTLFDVVNGVVGYENVEVGVIPCGSGNDYVKTFAKAEDFLSPDNFCEGVSVPVDLIKFEDKYCINIASIGMDAFVVKQKNDMKKLSEFNGELAYIVSVFITFIKNMGGRFKVTVDDKDVYDRDFLFVVAANGRYYGGSFNPTPNACVNDGLIDILLLNSVSRFTVIKLLKKYQKGLHINLTDICKIVRGKRIVIESEKEIPVNVDGEIYNSAKITFEMVEKGVKFIVPKSVLNSNEALNDKRILSSI